MSGFHIERTINEGGWSWLTITHDNIPCAEICAGGYGDKDFYIAHPDDNYEIGIIPIAEIDTLIAMLETLKNEIAK
jgi:hypothetical protein